VVKEEMRVVGSLGFYMKWRWRVLLSISAYFIAVFIHRSLYRSALFEL
jgi:hypothetical protein